jgi:hypothetical protein
MKNIVLLTFQTLLLLSCNQSTKEYKELSPDTIQSIDLTLKSKKNNNIIGEWSICSYSISSGNESQVITANVCPTVEFNQDGTIGAGFTKWKIDGHRLIISDTTPSQRSFFTSGNYDMVYRDNDSTNLTLMSIGKGPTYFLGKK